MPNKGGDREIVGNGAAVYVGMRREENGMSSLLWSVTPARRPVNPAVRLFSVSIYYGGRHK